MIPRMKSKFSISKLQAYTVQVELIHSQLMFSTCIAMIKFDIHPWNDTGHFPISETQWKFKQFGSLVGWQPVKWN